MREAVADSLSVSREILVACRLSRSVPRGHVMSCHDIIQCRQKLRTDEINEAETTN